MVTLAQFFELLASIPFLALVILLVLGTIFVNGATDAANAIAEVVGTRSMDIDSAITMSVICNFIGLIGMTGVRSRYIVATCGVMLMILGLFPKMAAVVASVPTMVLGGAGLAMFGMVAASGFQALSKANLHKKGNIMVVAISVAIALIPIGVPSFYSKFPTWVQIICNSGITIGSITAIILNLFLRDAPDPDEEKPLFSKSAQK